MPVPVARGPLSAALRAVLAGEQTSAAFLTAVQASPPPLDVLHDDVQLTLTMLYELHLQGLVGVSDDWEWDTDLLAARAVLEVPLAAALDTLAGHVECTPDTLGGELDALTTDDGTPGLARVVARQAQLWQVQEVLVHRSLYQLREADPPHPRDPPTGRSTQGGAGRGADRRVWRRPTRADALGAVRPHHDRPRGGRLLRRHVDRVPAITLASLNALSYLALHRSRLGELVGHLCTVEMTSSAPSKLYSTGLRRLGFDRDATRFYDEHVEADAMHEQIVARDLAGGLARTQPHRAPHVLWGARICAALDDLVGAHITSSWAAGRSSLLS